LEKVFSGPKLARSLVALHCGHGRGHVVDDGEQLRELFARVLGLRRW
jgi:hypothetical protein